MIKSNKFVLLGVFITNFIIFDLEFNSTKNKDTNRYINEIIEIGAVKLNDELIETDSFSSVIKPCYSKKLNPYVKTLTHIEEKELKNAEKFPSVIKSFTDWCNADKNTVFITWSNTDLHVMVENYNQLLKKEKVDFIENYSDLQKYVSTFIKTENNNQISLKTAAEFYKINTSKFELHRAEDDSRICGKILLKSYNKDIFDKHILNVNHNDFYKRLLFRPYTIKDLKKEKINKDDLYFNCPVCNNKLKFNHKSKFNTHINAFTDIIKCDKCKKKIAVTFRFKKNFDNITVSKRAKEYIKKEKEK